MENEIKQIGETSYVLKLFPAMTGLSIISRIEKSGGFTEDIILEVITKGVLSVAPLLTVRSLISTLLVSMQR